MIDAATSGIVGSAARGEADAEPGQKGQHWSVLGVPISALTMDDVLIHIARWISRKERHYICTLDVNALMSSQSAADVHDIYRSASLVAPDGMPLVWLLRRAGFRCADRICGPDLMPALFDRSQQENWRHYLYGSTEKTLALLKANLLAQYPNANIVGCESPPYRALTEEEEQDTVGRLNAASPDIIWVGLGAPKQDRWMAQYRGRLEAPVLIGVGAAFDMMAGTVKRAPRFIRRSGFEWVYRLMQEPRRLWKRYLTSNSRFAMLMIGQEIQHLFNRRAVDASAGTSSYQGRVR